MARKESKNDVKLTELLKWIDRYIERYHFSPSIRDITTGFPISSTSVTNFYLRKLERRGWIESTPRAARSIRLTLDGFGIARPGTTWELETQISDRFEQLANIDIKAAAQLAETMTKRYPVPSGQKVKIRGGYGHKPLTIEVRGKKQAVGSAA